VGDLWYNSNANRQTLNIWSGTGWVSASGVTVGGTGARVILPGYFNENPSSTATADDIGGLAFKYSGGQTQLFLNKGNAWNSMTPMLGDASNSGAAVVGDSNGNLSWGPYNPPGVKWLDSVSNGGTSLWTNTFPDPQRYLKWNMSGGSDANCRLMVVMEQSAAWWDWSQHLPEAQAITSYESSGVREEYAGIKSGWWIDNAGGRITEDNSQYLIKANSTWHSVGHILLSDDRATFLAETNYTSDNNTPMCCIFRARWDTDMRNCNKFGFKYSTGSGWFVGHIEYG
jgi:hypothetical protein